MPNSIVSEMNNVQFPAFTGERIYMLPFTKDEALPAIASRWQSTVDQMLENIDTRERLYLMVDQGILKAGDSHRRGGAHIDGNWIESLNAHRPPGHGLVSANSMEWDTSGHSMNFKNETLLLASDVAGCVGYRGQWEGSPNEGGDCTHIDLSAMEPVLMEENKTYAGNLFMIHESIPVTQDCTRSLVRINVPNHIIGEE